MDDPSFCRALKLQGRGPDAKKDYQASRQNSFLQHFHMTNEEETIADWRFGLDRLL